MVSEPQQSKNQAAINSNQNNNNINNNNNNINNNNQNNQIMVEVSQADFSKYILSPKVPKPNNN
jgi:hypothetical protein